MATLNELRDKAYNNSKAHGFHDDPESEHVGVKLMLITSELGEALEADRKDKHAQVEVFFERLTTLNTSFNGDESDRRACMKDNFNKCFVAYMKDSFEDELADALIRIFDLAGSYGIDLETCVSLKMQYNEGREHKHGKAY